MWLNSYIIDVELGLVNFSVFKSVKNVNHAFEVMESHKQ